jgi:alpha-ribazole phosphatase/probable phosphoglycerate mutase
MERMNRLYLARHGQVDGYDQLTVYGHTDVDITRVGVLQMEALAERLRLTDLRAIYASDLKRSLKGAEIIGKHHDVPFHVLPELREMFFGDWEGITLSELEKQFPAELKRRRETLLTYRIPGNGETIQEFSNRITGCYHQILSAERGHDFLIVAHGGVNRVILCQALGLDFSRMFSLHQDYGCLNIIDVQEENTVVRLVNG